MRLYLDKSMCIFIIISDFTVKLLENIKKNDYKYYNIIIIRFVYVEHGSERENKQCADIKNQNNNNK